MITNVSPTMSVEENDNSNVSLTMSVEENDNSNVFTDNECGRK